MATNLTEVCPPELIHPARLLDFIAWIRASTPDIITRRKYLRQWAKFTNSPLTGYHYDALA